MFLSKSNTVVRFYKNIFISLHVFKCNNIILAFKKKLKIAPYIIVLFVTVKR